MTEPDNRTPDQVDEQVDHLEEDADAMDRPDRAISLPADGEDDDEGVGPITVLVP